MRNSVLDEVAGLGSEVENTLALSLALEVPGIPSMDRPDEDGGRFLGGTLIHAFRGRG